jgi:uncharacterized membrane protein
VAGGPRGSRYVAQAGVIAAVYAAASLLAIQTPLGWGPVQLRLSEALTVVALFTPAAIPGLTLGTVVANSFMVAQFGPLALLDVVFGGLGTLLGALWMWRFRRRRALALAGPVVANALIVAAYLPLLLTAAGFDFYEIPVVGIDAAGAWFGMYVFGMVAIGIGQAIVVYGLGWPLARLIERAAPRLGIYAGSGAD